MAPKASIHVLVPGTCAYVTLHSKKEIIDLIKLRILRWGEYLELSGIFLNKGLEMNAVKSCKLL